MNKGDQEDSDSDWAEGKDAMPNGDANRGDSDCFFCIPIVSRSLLTLFSKNSCRTRSSSLFQGANEENLSTCNLCNQGKWFLCCVPVRSIEIIDSILSALPKILSCSLPNSSECLLSFFVSSLFPLLSGSVIRNVVGSGCLLFSPDVVIHHWPNVRVAVPVFLYIAQRTRSMCCHLMQLCCLPELDRGALVQCF